MLVFVNALKIIVQNHINSYINCWPHYSSINKYNSDQQKTFSNCCIQQLQCFLFEYFSIALLETLYFFESSFFTNSRNKEYSRSNPCYLSTRLISLEIIFMIVSALSTPSSFNCQTLLQTDSGLNIEALLCYSRDLECMKMKSKFFAERSIE